MADVSSDLVRKEKSWSTISRLNWEAMDSFSALGRKR